jgi:hypothetical protein
LYDDVVQGNRGIVQLLIEVMSQQQNGIFQFAFAAFKRMIPEIADHDRGPDHDGRDQQDAAGNKPANWIAPGRQFIIDKIGLFSRIAVKHRIYIWQPPQHFFALPGGLAYRPWVEVTLVISVTQGLIWNFPAKGPRATPHNGACGREKLIGESMAAVTAPGASYQWRKEDVVMWETTARPWIAAGYD